MEGAMNVRVAWLLPLWSDLEPTKTDILKLVQGNYFNEEIKILKDFQTQTESLDPYLDTSGLLRVGGQIKKTNLSDSLKKPVILPKTGHITEPVLHHAHEKNSPQWNRRHLKQTSFKWLLDYQRECCSQTLHIKVCHMLISQWYFWRTENGQPLKFRVKPAPQFSYCAMDYFGPWYIKEGRKEV